MSETAAIVEVAERALMIYASGDICAAMLMNTENALKRTCYHESGHCVVGMLLGKRPFNIEIFSTGAGVCRFTGFQPEDDECQFSDAQRAEQVHAVLEMGNDLQPDDGAIRLEVEILLRAHWSLIAQIAESLYSRLSRDANGCLLGGLIWGSELLKRWEFSMEKENGNVQ